MAEVEADPDISMGNPKIPRGDVRTYKMFNRINSMSMLV